MGWCSGTTIFDEVARHLLHANIGYDEKLSTLRVLKKSLQNHDWDCELDTDLLRYQLVKDALKEELAEQEDDA